MNMNIKPKYRAFFISEIGWVVQKRTMLFFYKWATNLHDYGLETKEEANKIIECALDFQRKKSPYRAMR